MLASESWSCERDGKRYCAGTRNAENKLGMLCKAENKPAQAENKPAMQNTGIHAMRNTSNALSGDGKTLGFSLLTVSQSYQSNQHLFVFEPAPTTTVRAKSCDCGTGVDKSWKGLRVTLWLRLRHRLSGQPYKILKLVYCPG